MSLILDESKPNGLMAKSIHGIPSVQIGEYDISLRDFLCLAEYVLTNTDLEPEDLRLQFVEHVKLMKVVDGWNAGGKRLELDC